MNEMKTGSVSLNNLFDYFLRTFANLQKSVDVAEMFLDECANHADLAEIEAGNRVDNAVEVICKDKEQIRVTVQLIEDMTNVYKSCGFSVDTGENETLIQ